MNFLSIKRNKRLKIILLSTVAVFFAGSFAVSIYIGYQSKFVHGVDTKSVSEEKVEASEIEEININPRLFDFGLYIQKISLAVPVIANVDGTNKTAFSKALLSGVAHYNKTALPNEKGNVFIFGHSSTWNGTGDYAEAFARLNDLKKDDQVIIYYQNKEYKHKVWKKEIIAADDFSYLEPTKSQQLTLMTCWPPGSNLKRLVVIARMEDP